MGGWSSSARVVTIFAALILTSCGNGSEPKPANTASAGNPPPVAEAPADPAEVLLFAVKQDPGGIFTLDVDSGEASQITDGSDFGPVASPTGDRIAFTRTSSRDLTAGGGAFAVDAHIFVIPADGGKALRLTAFLGQDPDWSPSGKEIAFTSCGPEVKIEDCVLRDAPDIYVMRSDGAKPALLVEGAQMPAYSQDGDKLAFAGVRDGTPGIFVADADGSHESRLTSEQYPAANPSWSPDGRFLTFARMGGGPNGTLVPSLIRLSVDGSKEKELVRLEGGTGDGVVSTWATDAKRIFFSAQSSRLGDQLFVINADGSNMRRLQQPKETANTSPSLLQNTAP